MYMLECILQWHAATNAAINSRQMTVRRHKQPLPSANYTESYCPKIY